MMISTEFEYGDEQYTVYVKGSNCYVLTICYCTFLLFSKLQTEIDLRNQKSEYI